MSKRSKLVGIIALLAMVSLASLAIAAKTAPSNGNFEAGSLKGWKTFVGTNAAPESWKVYKKGDDLSPAPPVRGSSGGGAPPTKLYAPPQGKYAAYGVGAGGGPRILYRTLHLKSNRKASLSMKVFYKNFATKFIAPNTLNPDRPKGNQQYRIDIVRAGAKIDSLKSKDVLMNVFRTKKGDNLKRRPFKVTTNLSSLAGKDVVLRLAETDTEYYFYPGVDAVKLKQKKSH